MFGKETKIPKRGMDVKDLDSNLNHCWQMTNIWGTILFCDTNYL